jgi:hypothetical protein
MYERLRHRIRNVNNKLGIRRTNPQSKNNVTNLLMNKSNSISNRTVATREQILVPETLLKKRKDRLGQEEKQKEVLAKRRKVRIFLYRGERCSICLVSNIWLVRYESVFMMTLKAS